MFALWLTAALAAGGSATSDRYPAFQVVCTALLVGAGLVVTLALLQAVGPRVRWLGSPPALGAAFCVLFAAALSLDLQELRASLFGATRLLLLGGSVALAAWSLRRARFSRLSLSAAMAWMCLAWVLCGVLRASTAAGVYKQLSLLPLVAGLVVLLPGLPRLDPLFSPARRYGTLVACAALMWPALHPRLASPPPLVSRTARAPAGRRSAMMIVLDTLRRDHMSLYGYDRKTTPVLDRRAGSALVFDDATSVAPWTLPAHASMFTGLWPRTHGAHAGRSEKDQPLNSTPLAPEHLTLAEIGREHGYRTAGFTANHFYLAPSWGMAQGFEEYLCRRPRPWTLALRHASKLARWWDPRRVVYEEKPYLTAPEITRAAIRWLERHRDTPFFLFLNYMEAHVPNATPGSQGLPFEDESFLPGAETIWRRLDSPAERRSAVNEYDREIAHLDRWVGVLLDYLERSGLGATTLVIVTSDHGEFLGEHELFGHGKDVYAEVVNVPLIVWQPGAAPGRSSRPVQSPDLFPTILRYLGLPVPEGTQGQALLDAIHPTVSEQYHQPHNRNPRFDRIIRSIRVGEHRYFASSSGEERLFHIGEDPFETRELILERPGVAALARARLAEWLINTPEAPPRAKDRQLEAEALEDLRALGYIQ